MVAIKEGKKKVAAIYCMSIIIRYNVQEATKYCKISQSPFFFVANEAKNIFKTGRSFCHGFLHLMQCKPCLGLDFACVDII